jgi:hypothetical protein
MVKVYSFEMWDQAKGEMVIQPLKSPASHIIRIGGKIISGTAEEVDPTCLNAEGRYDCRKVVPNKTR